MSKIIKVWQMWLVALGLAVVLMGGSPMMTMAQASATAPANWCTSNAPWQVINLANAPDPGCTQAGQVALDVDGDVDRYPTFAAAEAARNGRDGTFYYEMETAEGTNTETPLAGGSGVAAGTTFEIVVTEDLSASEATLIGEINWEKWLTDGTAIVFSNAEGTLNVASLDKLNVEGLDGVVVVLEPWRPGCGKTLPNQPQSEDDDCNPGAAWLFTNWQDAIEWLAENNWPEGSMWYRPGDSIGQEGTKTCVAALTPAGTAINIAPDRSKAWQVCPQGFSDPDWVVQGMMNYAPVNKLLTDARTAYSDLQDEAQAMKEELDELRALKATFCAANSDHAACD